MVYRCTMYMHAMALCIVYSYYKYIYSIEEIVSTGGGSYLNYILVPTLPLAGSVVVVLY